MRSFAGRLFVFFLFVLIAVPSGDTCCSLRAASFSSTKGLAAEVRKDGKLVHLLAYQNTVRDSASTDSGGNAMFLPIPAKARTMTSANILDTSSAKHFLSDIDDAIRPPVREVFRNSNSVQRGIDIKDVVVFEHDIYTIVLARNATDIPAALSRVPESKRPKMNKPIFDAYARWYPGWTFALCCFNNKDATTAAPMLWWYEPMKPDQLFFPGLDAHDGNPPRIDAKNIDVDHSLAVAASFDPPGGEPVRYTDALSPSLGKILPKFVSGDILSGELPQGDFIWNLADVRAGKHTPHRALPPGASGRADLGLVTALNPSILSPKSGARSSLTR